MNGNSNDNDSAFVQRIFMKQRSLLSRYRHRQSGSTACRLQARPARTGPWACGYQPCPVLVCRLMVANLVIHVEPGSKAAQSAADYHTINTKAALHKSPLTTLGQVRSRLAYCCIAVKIASDSGV